MKYQSRYSPGKEVSAANYIIELICEKKAALENKDLPIKFWNLAEWSLFYKRWLRQTHKLLKQYDATAIIRALTCIKAGRRYSLHTEYMLDLIQREQNIIDIQKKCKDVEYTRDNITSKPRQTKPEKNIISILENSE